MKWPFSKNKKDYPADRFSAVYIEDILKDTDKYELTRIPDIFVLLLTSSNKLKRRTAKVLTKYVSGLNMNELTKLDAMLRERTSLDWSIDWSKENPENLLLPNMTEEQRVIILGLCSFHPNGYLREKAVTLLGQNSSGKEWPYLLLRCNDWVEEVRGTAEKYVERRLYQKYMSEIVSSLPLIFKWKDKNNHLFQQAALVFSKPESYPFLEEGTKAKDREVRYYCYQMLIHTKLFNKELLLNYYQAEKEPHSRLFLFNELINNLSVDEFKEFYPILKKDKFPFIRLKVLEKFYTYFQDASYSELESALLDKSSTIRILARFLLKKLDTSIVFSRFYIDRLNSNKNVRESLLGIGETGRKEHAQLTLPFLYNSNISISKAAIRALSMLDGDKHKLEFVQLLQSEQQAISKAARKAIEPLYYHDIKDQLYDIYKVTSYDHTKYNIALLLCSLPKWEAIIYILMFYINTENRDVSRLGKTNFLKWIVHFNRSFETPSTEQINVLRTLLLKHRNKLQQEEVKAIEFCMKGFL